MNNIVDFISDLLADKGITVSEKERLFALTKDEIKRLGEDDEKNKEILARIEKLESFHTVQENNASSRNNLANPKDVANFMSFFNQRDGFKYLTHDYDEESDFEIDKFLASRKTFFDEKTHREVNIPKSLWTIVDQFAFRGQPKWTTISEDYKNDIKIEMGWGSKELIDWSKQNKIHPIRNEKYKKVINDFRRITRIESPNLETLIENLIDNIFAGEKKNFEFEIIDLSKADFYTHVINLKKSFKNVFEEIKKRSDEDRKKKVKIEYQRETEDGFHVRKILITHYNSFPTKELTVLLKEWGGLVKGGMGDIGDNMQGYCYWSVITKIEGSPLKINILKEKNTPDYEQVDISEAVGFTHVFTFYYK